MQIKYCLYFLPINIFFISLAHSATDNEKYCDYSSAAAVRMESYEYREVDKNKQLIDKEDGLLPGLSLGLAAKCQQWEFAVNGGMQRARLDYDGQTNTGRKFLTRTDENISEISIQVSRRFSVGSANSIGVYGGAGYWQWQRNINSKDNVSGLDEKYSWRYYYLGGNVALVENNAQQLLVDVRWLRRTQAKLSVDFRGVLDRPEDLSLNVHHDWRVALPWQFNLDPTNSVRIEPYVEKWHIDQTATKTLYRQGVQVGNFFEPASQTQLYGITFNWLHHF